MKKQSLITILLTMLMSMVGVKAFAYDIEAKNSDGVSIYYNWVNSERTELSVSGSWYSSYYSGDVVIPNSVLYEGKYYSVTSIGFNAFSNCSGLSSITIPNSITKIGDQAFYGCSGLTSITLPNSITSIGEQSFYGCSGLTSLTIPNSVTEIGSHAFASCSALSTINMSNNVTSVGNEAFSETSWYKNQPDGLIYISKVTYKYKGEMPSNTTITIKDGTTGITANAFNSCQNLVSVTFPNSLKSIGSQAFYNCSNLKTIVSEISTPFKIDNLFSDYSYISSDYFNRITLIVPSGKKESYQSTDGWMNFTNIVEVGKGGLEGQTFLADGINYSIKENKSVSVAYNNGSYVGKIVIPTQVTFNGIDYSVTAIDNSAFSGCKDLTSVNIPEGVTQIGNSAFWGCSRLMSIIIPNGVTTISSYTFADCSSLSSLTIGSGVTSIDYNAFSGTSVKKTIWLTNTPPSNYSNAAGTINYVSNDQYPFSKQAKYQFLSSMFEVDGIRYVPISLSERTCDAIDCVYDESASITKIAPTVTYKGVTFTVKNVKPYICYNNKYITYLSAEVEGLIDQYTFYGCSNMQTAILGKTNNDIDKDKFTGIYIGSNVNEIGNNVFMGCESLNRLFIANRELELKLGYNINNYNGYPIFNSCPIESVYIGGNITYDTTSGCGYSPFYRNTAIRSVTITDKETEISENEFYGCTNLQRVSIGDGLKTIGNWAFSGCQSLTYFAFGSKLENIGKEAFSDCTKVGEIISKTRTAPVCGSQALDDINKWDCKLYVPDGTISSYQTADQWKEFIFAAEGTGTAEQNPSGEGPLKCGTPKITYSGDKISFTCDTDGVKYIYRINGSDEKAGNGNEVGLQKKYTISVYATKDGYVDSDVAKSTIEIGGSGILGDVNNDGEVNVADHVTLSEIIMNK